MKKFYLLSIFLISSFQFYGQTWRWTYSNYASSIGMAVAFDKSGNLFLSGGFDCFIEKFNPIGDSLWRIATGSSSGPSNMSIGPDTSIFLVGNGYGGYSSFVKKCDKDGNIIWNYSNSAGDSSPINIAKSIAVDSQGNSYASGKYNISATFGSCNFASPDEGIFVVKLSPAGNCLWSMDIQNGGSQFSHVAIDNNDDLIVTTPDSIIKVSNNQVQWVLPIVELRQTWHPSVGEVNTDSANNIYFIVSGDSLQIGQSIYVNTNDWLLVKLNPSGGIIWVKNISIPTPLESIFLGKAIYVTSYYDTRIEKISLDGDSLWSRTLTSDNQNEFHIYNITGSDSGLIAITGRMYGYVMDGNDTILHSNNLSAFVAVLDDIGSTTNINVNNKSERSLNIFPNPSTGIVTLHSSSSTLNSQLKVYDTFGSLIHQQIITSSNQQINLSEQPKGVYFLEIISDNKREMRKIVLN